MMIQQNVYNIIFILAVDNPVLHYPINGMVIQKVNELVLDIMPSRHLLFLNVF